ncbi:MAG: hypothetical protein Fur0044_05260 [Anaerolineae bacterium]
MNPPNSELFALQAAGAAIASNPDLQYVLQIIANEMLNILSMESCIIFRWNETQDTLTVLAAADTLSHEKAQTARSAAYFVADYPLIQQTLRQRRSQQLTASQTEANGTELAWLQQNNLKTVLTLPMECRDQMVGVIQAVSSQSERTFTLEELGLAQLLANQTASAIENARLHRAEQSRREELEAVQNVSLNLTASLELSDVFDAILSAALELVAAEDAHIFLYETGQLTFGAMMDREGRHDQPFSQPRPQGLTYTVAQSGEAVIIPDMRNHPLFADAPADWYGAIIGMPLKVGERVVGVMNAFYAQPYAFSDREISTLRILAGQAAIAIENARLYAETEQRAQQLAILNELDRAISATLHLDDIYHAFARHTTRLLAYDQISIYLLEEEHILVVYEANVDDLAPTMGAKLPLKSSAAGWVIAHGQPLLRHNIAADSRFAEDEQRVAAGLQSSLVLPLRFKRKIIGAWQISSRQKGAYHPDHLEIGQAIADQLANAIENARLYKQARLEISERKQIEAALRASEERFRQVISSITDHIYVTEIKPDGQRINIYHSPHVEALTGYAIENFNADWRFWPSVAIHPDDREAAAEQAARLAQGQNSEIEYRMVRADGEIIWVRDSARVEIDANNSKIIYGVVSNITQRKQLETQFLQSQKMDAVGRLAGGVAHDFNNLLTVINGYSELLLHRYLNETMPFRRYVEEIKKAGQRATALTGQLLAFSRKQVLQPKIFYLNDVVADMDKMLQRLIGEDIELICRPRTGLGKVKADPGQIEQVILNLVVNARDAMPNGGKITLETDNLSLDQSSTGQHLGLEPGRYVVLTVKDTGAGIDPKVLPHIFEPFFTTKEKGKGTGLGLATVYGIVNQSGGQIDVASQPGLGTTFTIYLPEVEQAIEPSAPEQLDEAPDGDETILLVEDEDMVRELSRTILLRHGYHVLEAAYGAEALQISQRYEGMIDLLATDVVMPQMSGRELAERLLQLRPNLKVLYMSGYTEDTIVHHGVTEPGVAFLPKPFTPTVLARKVREVLDA